MSSVNKYIKIDCNVRNGNLIYLAVLDPLCQGKHFDDPFILCFKTRTKK